ncbi:MAG TPA: hypothetical protein VE422_41735 [Terriglobia bacterium]|nr:hypothetical protein [Terriglobia bacterium]
MTWSERFYSALLFLYPVEFRVRYGPEMVQLFRDCSREEELFALWLRTLKDLALSIPRERVRDVMSFSSFESPARGVIDSLVVLSIIGANLFLGGGAVAFYLSRGLEPFNPSTDFILLWGISAVGLGGLGILRSLILARFRQIQYRLIKL